MSSYANTDFAGCVYRALPESSPDDEGDVTEDDAGPVLVLDNDSMIQKSSVPQKLLDNFDNFPKLQMVRICIKVCLTAVFLYC